MPEKTTKQTKQTKKKQNKQVLNKFESFFSPIENIAAIKIILAVIQWKSIDLKNYHIWHNIYGKKKQSISNLTTDGIIN